MLEKSRRKRDTKLTTVHGTTSQNKDKGFIKKKSIKKDEPSPETFHQSQEKQQIHMEVKPAIETFAKITVVGVGGSGNSAINRMIDAGLKGIDFLAINTDAQALHHNSAAKKIHIGQNVTRGLGAGMDPSVGRLAAEETQDQIKESLKGVDMVFITCGLGGGTGTGAAPVVANIARELGALTVGVVTTPFSFEGAHRMNIAQVGMRDIREHVDTIITIPNDQLLKIVDKKTSLLDSFKVVDDVLRQGVQGISEIITVPGLINVDFADVKTIMQSAGSALMGIGESSGENRALEAAQQAIDSPMLDLSIDGARGILFTITGSPDLSMDEVNEAARLITSSADPESKIIFGAIIDENLEDTIKVTVIATGFGDSAGIAKTQTGNTNAFGRDEEEEEAPFKFSRRPVFTEQDSVDKSDELENDNDLNKPVGRSSNKENQEEELEIPAFIRKKLKS